MLELSELSHLGLGMYRFSTRSSEHSKALACAVNQGVNLIDTAANYTGGESERLVGQFVQENPLTPLFIITKFGYLQGESLDLLRDKNLENLEVLDFGDHLKHSIHPDLLEAQYQLTLQRFQGRKPDAILLHNPEYFFEKFSDQDEYYQRILEALQLLEDWCIEGRIRYYGVSSNHFPYPADHPKKTCLATILEKLKATTPQHHFKFVQFPFNLVENEALSSEKNQQSLIELITKENLISLANRPLNAFKEQNFYRLATYPTSELLELNPDQSFQLIMDLTKQKLVQQGEDPTLLKDVPLLKQVSSMWKDLPTPDAVDQVFLGHFFPLIAKLWGVTQLGPTDSAPFYQLYDLAQARAREKMGLKARVLQEELIKKNLLSSNDVRPLAHQAIDYILKSGVDHVLVGMKKEQYVNGLQALI